MDNLWKIAKKRGRIVPSYCGSVGPVCCGPSLGLLGLRRGGEGEALDEWCPPEADVFMSYPRGGHGKYMIILINVISSAYFVCYTSGYVHPARLLAYD